MTIIQCDICGSRQPGVYGKLSIVELPQLADTCSHCMSFIPDVLVKYTISQLKELLLINGNPRTSPNQEA